MINTEKTEYISLKKSSTNKKRSSSVEDIKSFVLHKMELISTEYYE